MATAETIALPRLIVAVDQNRQPFYYRISVRADGSFKLRPIESLRENWQRKPAILVLSPELVFQRDGRIYPKDRRTLETLALDLFPFKEKQVTFAARRLEQQKPVFYALTPQRLAEIKVAIQDPGLNYRLILVADTQPDAILAALEERLREGSLSDLSSRPFTVRHPAFGRLLILILLLVLLIAAGWQIMGESQTALQQKINGLRENLGQTEQQYESLGLMQDTLEQLAKFDTPQYRRAYDKLLDILNQIPAGSVIERISFSGEQIVVSGYGNDAEKWLGKNALKADQLDVRDLPQKDAFTATFRLQQ